MAGPVSVVEANEIYFGDTYFPIKGPVQLTNIAIVPNPVVFGDTDKTGDTQIMSQEIQTSSAGGSGVWRSNPRTDIDRCWTSQLDTRYRNQFMLPPLSYDLGKPSGLTTEDPLVSLDYQSNQYVVFAGGKLHRWNDAAAVFTDGAASGGWSGLLATTPGNPTDILVYQNCLFVALDVGLCYYSLPAATLTTVGSSPSYYLEVWDEKLWRLYLNNGVWTVAFSGAAPGASMAWTVGGVFPTGVTPSQLTTFRNVLGDIVLCGIADNGLWLYDATNSKWRYTEIRIPQMPTGQPSKACFFRDGKIYFTSGNMGLVSVQAGNPFIATPVGLDLDDGVPMAESGKISRVAADFNFVLGLVDSTDVVETDLYTSGIGSPFDTPEWDQIAGISTLRAWNGGWHRLWDSDANSSPGQFLTVSGAYGKRRVYWGNAGKVYCMDLFSGVHNPRRNPTAKFARGPKAHITPWLDYGSDIQNKIQGHLYLRTAGCSSTETVTVWYQLDQNELAWSLFGVLTSNGISIFKPGDGTGMTAKTIRFRFDLARGTDPTRSPIIELWTTEFLRLLPAQYGYAVTVDLSKNYRNLSPAQLAASLQRLADPAQTPNLQQFAYRDVYETETQTHYGRISKITGSEYPGSDLRGQSSYLVSIMTPYKEDSL